MPFFAGRGRFSCRASMGRFHRPETLRCASPGGESQVSGVSILVGQHVAPIERPSQQSRADSGESRCRDSR